MCLPLSPDRLIVRRVTQPVYLPPGTGTLVYNTRAQALEKKLKKGPYLVVCSNFSQQFTRSSHLITVDFRILEERRENPVFEADRPPAPGKFEITPKSTTSRSLLVVPAAIPKTTGITRSLSAESKKIDLAL